MRKPKLLTHLRIDEVSAVDRGAGEGVRILLSKRDDDDLDEPYWKREFSTDQRRADAKSGAAESDGSYPIHNASDLHNAMQAVGRSKNPGKTKAHIRARARALGLTDKLSDAFKRDNMKTIAEMFSKVFGGGNNDQKIDKSIEGLAESVTSILGAADDDAAKGAALTKTFEQFSDHLKSTLTAGPAVAKQEANMDLAVIKKALGLADSATEADVSAAIAKNLSANVELVADVKKMKQEVAIAKADFTAAELAFYNKASEYDDEEKDEEGDGDPKGKGKPSKKKAFRLASHAERDTILKAAEPALPAHIQKIFDDNAAMAKRLADLEAGGNLVVLTKQATEAGLPESEGATIQKALQGDKAAVEKLLGFVKSATAQARAGGVFKEFGSSSGTGVVDTAYDELVNLAKAQQKIEPALSFEKAFAKVYENPANADVVKRERGQNRPATA